MGRAVGRRWGVVPGRGAAVCGGGGGGEPAAFPLEGGGGQGEFAPGVGAVEVVPIDGEAGLV